MGQPSSHHCDAFGLDTVCIEISHPTFLWSAQLQNTSKNTDLPWGVSATNDCFRWRGNNSNNTQNVHLATLIKSKVQTKLCNHPLERVEGKINWAEQRKKEREIFTKTHQKLIRQHLMDRQRPQDMFRSLVEPHWPIRSNLNEQSC